jgi:hypothetical protein
MASSKPILTDTYPVAADMSGDQFLFVTLNSSGELELPTVNGGPVLGILADTPRAGTHGTVTLLGIEKVKAGAAITPLQPLAATTAGKAVPAVAGNAACAIALEAAASGDVFSVLVIHATPVGDLASGVATLVAGTAAIANTAITANSVVLTSRQAAGGTLGHLSVANTAGAGFAINSSAGADTSKVYWQVISL